VKKRLQTLLLVSVAATCVVVLYQRWFPNDEKLIRRRLDSLATLVSVPEHPTATGNLAAGDRLRDFLTADIELDIEVPGEGRHTVVGRQDILQTVVASRAGLGGLRVQFLDPQVALDPAQPTATADLTVRATQPGQGEFFVQELKLILRKEDRQWRICKVQTMRTLKL
jgi:hypothetical protein